MMDPTLITLVSGAGAALASAIIALWRTQAANHAEVKEDLRACRVGHDEAHKRELELVEKVAAVDAKISGYMEAKDDLRDLSETVISIINEDREEELDG